MGFTVLPDSSLPGGYVGATRRVAPTPGLAVWGIRSPAVGGAPTEQSPHNDHGIRRGDPPGRPYLFSTPGFTVGIFVDKEALIARLNHLRAVASKLVDGGVPIFGMLPPLLQALILDFLNEVVDLSDHGIRWGIASVYEGPRSAVE